MKIMVAGSNNVARILAARLAFENNEVFLYSPGNYPFSLAGMCSKVSDWKMTLPDIDLLVLTDTNHKFLVYHASRFGKPTFDCFNYNDPNFKDFPLSIKDYIIDPDSRGINYDEGFVGRLNDGKYIFGKTKAQYKWISTFPGLSYLRDYLPGTPLKILTTFNGRYFTNYSMINHYNVSKCFYGGGIKGHADYFSKIPNLDVTTEILSKNSYRGFVVFNVVIYEHQCYILDISGNVDDNLCSHYMIALQEPLADVLFETAQGVKNYVKFSNDYVVSNPIVSKVNYTHFPIELRDDAIKYLSINHIAKDFEDVSPGRFNITTNIPKDVIFYINARAQEPSSAIGRLNRTYNIMRDSNLNLYSDATKILWRPLISSLGLENSTEQESKPVSTIGDI